MSIYMFTPCQSFLPPAQDPSQKQKAMPGAKQVHQLGLVLPRRDANPRARSRSREAAPAVREWKDQLAKAFLSNELSARRVSQMAVASQDAGAAGVGALAFAGHLGRAPRNLARDITRHLAKSTMMPS